MATAYSKTLRTMRTFLLNTFILTIACGLIWSVGRYFYYETDFYFKLASTSEEYGIKYNDKRKELGIRLVEENWFTRTLSQTTKNVGRSSTSEENYWSSQIWSDYKEKPKPYHKEKELLRTDYDELSKESDRWESRENDSTTYLLEVNYSYLATKRGEDPWSATLIKTTDGVEHNQEDFDMTTTQADSVLIKWGL